MTTHLVNRKTAGLRSALTAGVMAITILAMPAALWAEEQEPRVEFGLGWDGYYRPFRWTPATLTIHSRYSEHVAAQVSVEGQQDSLTSVATIQNTVLNPQVPTYLPLAIKLDHAVDGITVQIRRHDRRSPVFNKRYDSYSGQGRSLTSLSHNDLLIGVCGERFGVTALEQGARTSGGKVYVGSRRVEMLPWDWTGYDGLNLLMLVGLDWNMLNSHQSRAIVEWIGKGGRLLLVPGDQPLPAAHPLAALLPIRLDAPQKVRSGGRDSREITRWFTAEHARKAGMNVSVHNEAFVATAGYGFGSVAVMSSSPGELDIVSTPEQRTRFWIERACSSLGKHDAVFAGHNDSSYSSNYYGYEVGPEGAASNEVIEHLFAIEELRPLSIWWIVLLLGVLAVVVGPLDFLILRIFDRLPWTWITSGLIIALFTVGAYYGVKALRAGDTTVRSVGIIDAIDPAVCGRSGPVIAWSTCYTGIFASDSDSYQVTNLDQRQWWSSISATESSYSYAYQHEQLAARRLQTVQQDGGNLPVSLPISIWSMQCLLAEQPVGHDELPVAASVSRDEHGLTLELVNVSGATINGAILLHDETAYHFGSVPAGKTVQLHQANARHLHFRGEIHKVHSGSANGIAAAHGVRERTDAIEQWLKRGAAVVLISYTSARSPHSVEGHRVENHVQFVRLVVPVQERGEP